MTHFLRKHWSQIQYSSNNLKYKDRGHQIHANNKLYFPSIFRGILDSMQLGNLKTSFIFFFRNFLAHIYHKKTLESLDFSAQYWIVDYSFSSFKKKWTLNALKIKKKIPWRKREFAERNAIILLQILSFPLFSILLPHAWTITQHSFSVVIGDIKMKS